MTKLKRLCRAFGIGLAMTAFVVIAILLFYGLGALPFWLGYNFGGLAAVGCFLAYVVIIATAVIYSELATGDRGDLR